MEQFNFFLPISKIDKEKRTISGYASTPTVDLDGETVTLDAIKKALPAYWEWRNVRAMHRPEAVGVGQEAHVDSKGLFLTAKIVDDDAWNKCVEKVYKGFSIGGRKLTKTGNTITEIDLIEISVVDRPANPECKFDVQKSAKDGGEAYLLPILKSRKSSDREALSKMAQVVEILSDSNNLLDEPTLEVIEKNDAPLPSMVTPGTANGNNKIKSSKNKAALAKQASDFGIQLSKEWNKKLAKSLIAKAKVELGKPPLGDSTKPAPTLPLTLGAGGGAEADRGKIELSHGLDLAGGSGLPLDSLSKGNNSFFTKRERKLLKRMGVAGQLSYCFDSLRDAQRSLISESVAEGGDAKDKGLATKLGVVAQQLAAIIGQKAEHEGQEALDLSDAGDRYLRSTLKEDGFNMSANMDLNNVLLALAKRGRLPTRAEHFLSGKDNMKKAKDTRKKAEACVKSAHGLIKAHYLAKDALAKAGKKDEADKTELDLGKVMGELQKAYGALKLQKTFAKAAGESFAKAAGRIGGHGGEVEDPISGVYEVPPGVRTISPGEMNSLGPAHGQTVSNPGPFQLDGPDRVKTARSEMLTKSEADALARNAVLEAENTLLKSMPVGGTRPAVFDMSKLGMGSGQADNKFLAGINVADFGSVDGKTRDEAIAKLIGNRIINNGGRSVFDPAFHGTAGAKA